MGLKRRRKQHPTQRGVAQTWTQRYTTTQAYRGPQLYPPSFPQLQQTAGGAGQSVRRAGGSAGTTQRVSMGPCLDGAPSDVLPQDTDRHKRISGILLLSQCICVGRIVLS